MDDKLPFLRRMAKEFSWSLQCGDVEESYFPAWHIQAIYSIVNDPEAYYFERYANGPFRETQRELAGLRARLEEVESSTAWKVGRYITFVPRWIKRSLNNRR
jgi:hypothetical protein